MDKQELKNIAKKAMQDMRDYRTMSVEEKIAYASEQDRKKEKKAKKVVVEEHSEAHTQKLHTKKDSEEWDVPLGTPIHYFDPSLSYEITGYRPITSTQGLDFDPTPFQEMARIYTETGSYTKYLPGTMRYIEFGKRERDRCINGMTVGKYRITGDNYFWLNYYRLLSTVGGGQNKGRTESFPEFINKQYEYFHYMEMCEKLGCDFCALKSRGVGASEIACSIGANIYTQIANTRTVYAAKNEVLLEPTLEKVWQELDFLNMETNGVMKHLRMKKDTALQKKASKVDKRGNEFGHGSILEGIICDKPRKLRGRRVERLVFEESGSFPDLIETYVQARPLVVVNGTRIGTRYVFGTGGDTGPGLAGLSSMFYNPDMYDMLPYKHNYTLDGSVAYTGFFIPAYTMWFGANGVKGYDHRGVVDEVKAKEYYDKQRAKITDPSVLIKEKAEFCYCPEEALILEGDNQFNRELLVEQIANIEIHKTVEKPFKGRLFWGFKDGAIDRNSRPTFEALETGKIKFTELPMLDQTGTPYKNLYCAGIDSIDSDKSTSTGQNDVSNFCIVILRRQFGLKPPKVVALYKERPTDIRQAYDVALQLCQFYNCQALLEATRVSIKTYWQMFGMTNYLMRRPQSTGNSTRKTNFNQFGVPATKHIIEHQLDLIADYINDCYDQIDYLEMLNELNHYSYENKRKYDIVAALGMVMLADEEMMGKTPKQNRSVEYKELAELGYYTDAYGVKRFGVVPKVKEENYGWLSKQKSQGHTRMYLSSSF